MMLEPPADPLTERLRIADVTIRRAGAVAHEYFVRSAELTVERKGLQDHVTEADRAVEVLVREALAAAFPEDGFLGEEHGANAAVRDADWTWVVDPIDGTDCFINGIPVWCVSIALVGPQGTELGLIHDPNSEEHFIARRGHGATLNGQPIAASNATSLSDGIVGAGFSHRVAPADVLEPLERLLEAGGMFQRNGSGALMLAYVAAGRFLGYFEPHINAWDALAGLLLASEAGAWTNDFLAGNALHEGNAVYACAPGVRREFIELCVKPDRSNTNCVDTTDTSPV